METFNDSGSVDEVTTAQETGNVRVEISYSEVDFPIHTRRINCELSRRSNSQNKPMKAIAFTRVWIRTSEK